jgi:hypothetical protein
MPIVRASIFSIATLALPVTATADWDDIKKTVFLSRSDKATLPLGEFSVLQEWAQLESGPFFNEVMTGRIEFIPSKTAPACNALSYIQTAQVLDNQGSQYEWTMDDAPRNEMRSHAGYFVDHMTSQCSKGTSCSPFYRDHWPNTDEGSRDGRVAPNKVESAILTDYPFGWEYISSIRLEACAVCRDTMQVYGCFQWGGHWGLTTDRTFHPVSAARVPSREWRQALEKFSSHYR